MLAKIKIVKIEKKTLEKMHSGNVVDRYLPKKSGMDSGAVSEKPENGLMDERQRTDAYMMTAAVACKHK